MTERTSLNAVIPDGYRKLIALDSYIGANIEEPIKDLVYLRASLINGCNYCVHEHSVDLQAGGMPVRKIFTVTTWRESSFFDERERMALELTDAITNIAGGVSDELWERAHTVFSEKQVADLILAIGTIAIWNRIGISTHLPTTPLDETD